MKLKTWTKPEISPLLEKEDSLPTIRVIQFVPGKKPIEGVVPLAPGDNVADAIMADLIPRLWPDAEVT